MSAPDRPHTGVKRAAPKGTDWWRCPDCLTEGPLRALLAGECTAEHRQEPAEALEQAKQGTGKYGPDAEA